MRGYFQEGRRIDYFYTDRDEQSNFSLIEFVQDVPGLTKYRVDGEHSEVAKKALPTILTVLKSFLHGRPWGSNEKNFSCEQNLSFPASKGVGFQVRLGSSVALTAGPDTNVLLEGNLGRTIFRQLISNHTYDFIKYTAPGERMFAPLHAPASVTKLLHTTSGGVLSHGTLPPAVPSVKRVPAKIAMGIDAPLDLSPTDKARKYAVMALPNFPVSTYQYVVQEGSPIGDSVLLIIDPRGSKPIIGSADSPIENPRIIFTAIPSKRARNLELFAHRLAITANLESICVVISDPEVTDQEIKDLRNLYGPEVLCYDRRHVTT